MTPLLQLRNIHKHFGAVHALSGVDFSLAPGEVHALLGENGAGKSTLMHIAFGLTHADRGDLLVDGVSQRIRSPIDARRLGIGMVHQHFTSVPAFSVAENVALAAGWKTTPDLRGRVDRIGRDIGLPLDPDAPVWSLAVAEKQRLEIVKAVATDARILLLDEPTAVLAPQEADELYRVIRAFTARGGAAVLITHKLMEALAASDRLTVLRRGRVTYEGHTGDQDIRTVAHHMLGGSLPTEADQVPPAALPGTPRVVGQALDVARDGREGTAVHAAQFQVGAGEIVGLAALEGNGQRELLRAVAGLLPPLRGRLDVARPVAFIPEDRTTEGLIPEFSLTENLMLGLDHHPQWVRGRRWPRIDWAAARERLARVLQEYEVDAPGIGTPARTLSGGNQQKLVVARALEHDPQVIVAENPTRGLDLRASRAVEARLRAAARRGAAVLIYSSDLDDVIRFADRVVVMCEGRLTPAPAGADRRTIGEMMLHLPPPSDRP